MVLLLFLFAASALAAPVDFGREVHPILVSRCMGCHSNEKGQAGLSVATRAALLKGGASGAAVVPGSSSASLLIQRVTGEKPPRMPMGGAPLTDAEIAI